MRSSFSNWSKRKKEALRTFFFSCPSNQFSKVPGYSLQLIGRKIFCLTGMPYWNNLRQSYNFQKVLTQSKKRVIKVYCIELRFIEQNINWFFVINLILFSLFKSCLPNKIIWFDCLWRCWFQLNEQFNRSENVMHK